MKDKTCNECETWQKKKWNFCPSCSFGFGFAGLQLVCHATPRLAPSLPLVLKFSGLLWSPGLAPSFCFRSFVCGADCVARAMALLAVSNVLAAVSESRGQQPSQAAAVVVAAVAVAVAVAVAAATFHQCQLGIKLQTFTYGNFNWPLDEKSPLRRCHFATLSLLIFIFHIATRCSTGFLCYVIAVVVAVFLLIDHLFSWSLLIPLHPPTPRRCAFPSPPRSTLTNFNFQSVCLFSIWWSQLAEFNLVLCRIYI